MLSSNDNLSWYKLLIKLYPKTYREEYGEEMIATLQDMYGDVMTLKEKRKLLSLVFKDYLLSLSRESLYATGNSFHETPINIKRDYIISASLVAPFFLIYTYNISAIALHQADVLSSLEAHSWVIYSIILPLFSLVLSAKTSFSAIYGQLKRRNWREVLSTFFQKWLFLGVALSVLAIIAIT